MGEERNVYKVLMRKPEGKRPQSLGGRLGSEWIFWRLAWGEWIGSSWLRIGTGGELL
jgi:hypothetical protein